MFKLISTLIISLVMFSSCNTTAKFQKSFDNNEGILVIPLAYRDSNNIPSNIEQLINHKLTLEIINLDTKIKTRSSVVINLNNKYVVSDSFAPGKYEVIRSYYLVSGIKDLITEENIPFTIFASDFTVLPKALNYNVYFKDNTYWLTKKFLTHSKLESVKIENALDSMLESN